MPLMLVLAIASFAAGISQRMFDPMVPEVARDLATSPTIVALLTTAFALPYAIVMPFVGGLGDTIGKVRVIQGSVAALALTLTMSALAPDITFLFLARFLVGMANAGIFALSMGVIGDRVPFAERQVALSFLLMAVLSAQMFGMPVVGLLASAYGWRAVAWLIAGIAIVAMVVTLDIPEAPRAGRAAHVQRRAHQGRTISPCSPIRSRACASPPSSSKACWCSASFRSSPC